VGEGGGRGRAKYGRSFFHHFSEVNRKHCNICLAHGIGNRHHETETRLGSDLDLVDAEKRPADVYELTVTSRADKAENIKNLHERKSSDIPLPPVATLKNRNFQCILACVTQRNMSKFPFPPQCDALRLWTGALTPSRSPVSHCLRFNALSFPLSTACASVLCPPCDFATHYHSFLECDVSDGANSVGAINWLVGRMRMFSFVVQNVTVTTHRNGYSMVFFGKGAQSTFKACGQAVLY